MKHIQKQPRTTLAIALALLGLVSGSAQAALIVYDQFSDYTNGSLNGQGQGYGWGSNNWGGGTSATQAATVSSTGINETTDVTHFVVKMDFTTSGSHKAFLFVDPTTGSSFADLDADASYTFSSDWTGIAGGSSLQRWHKW